MGINPDLVIIMTDVLQGALKKNVWFKLNNNQRKTFHKI
jgi:hypothetical protein